MSTKSSGGNGRIRHLRKDVLPIILAAVLLISGCTPKLEIQSEGSWKDSFDDGRLNLSIRYIENELFLVAKNLTYEPIAIIWPEDSLIFPDGSRLTLGYLHKKALNQEATHELINMYLKESGGKSVSFHVLPNESVSAANFVDFSPRAIKALETAYYKLAAVKDPDDFAAPMKYHVDIDGKYLQMGAKVSGLKKGQQISWSFSYKLLKSNEKFNAELKVRIAG